MIERRLQKIGSFLIPPESISPGTESSKSILLSLYIAIAVVINLIFATVFLSINANMSLSISATFIALYSALGFFYRKNGNHRNVSYFFFALSITAIAFSSYNTGGADSPSIMWFLLLPIASGSILSQRDTPLVMGMSILSAGAYFVICNLFPPTTNQVSGFEFEFSYIAFFSVLMFGGVFTYLSNKSDQKTKEESIKKAELLFKSNERNRQLVRLLCHDIGNPLTVIQFHAEMLQMKTKDPSADKIIRACDVQCEILAEVRQLEAVGSGKETLNLTSVCFESVLEQSMFIFKAKLEQKNIEIDYQNLIGKKTYLLADVTGFTNHVFNNIISNAIKFSNQGDKIKIMISENNGLVNISISDSGIGIPKDIKEQLFDPEANTSRVGTDGEKGTGFGMPLVKTYMEKFEGTIEIETRCIESHPNDHGTTFHLFLKSAPPEEDSLSQAASLVLKQA